jgi:hypothetical protein
MKLRSKKLPLCALTCLAACGTIAVTERLAAGGPGQDQMTLIQKLAPKYIALPGGQVAGVVVASLPRQGSSFEIGLPDSELYLLALDGPSPSQAEDMHTDVRGRFTFPKQAPGAYQVCAQHVHFETACASIQVANQTTFITPHLALKPVGRYLYGRVTLRDGSAAVRSGSVYGAPARAEVSLAGRSGVIAGPVPVNASGFYIFSDLPESEPGEMLRATYENGVGSRAIVGALADSRADITIENSPPKLSVLRAASGGEEISNTIPGSTVTVTAEAQDPDGDALHYIWRDSNSSIISEDKPAIDWTLPEAAGSNVLFVEVSDGKGGIARASLTVPTFAASEALPAPALRSQVSALPIIPQHSGDFIDPTLFMTCDAVKDPDCKNEADQYYRKIGVYVDDNNTPSSATGSFDNWKKSFGFSADPTKPAAGEFRAVYYNNGDLRFGRDMHCVSTTPASSVVPLSWSACYVTNFGDGVKSFGSDPQTAIHNAEIEGSHAKIATVAMVSTVANPFAGQRNIPPQFVNSVNFYVYDAAGKPLSQAILDSQGPKSVPGVCMACHGGSYTSVDSQQPADSHTVSNARFLPFDAASFIFDGTSPSFSEREQRNAIRQLNGVVLNANLTSFNQITSSTISDLIKGWYQWCGGPQAPGCYIDQKLHPFVPASACTSASQPATCGWKQPFYDASQLYLQVPSKYCRTCHVANSDRFNLENYDAFQQARDLVKDAVFQEHYMPFAQVPYNNLWSDAAARQTLLNFLNTGAPASASK